MRTTPPALTRVGDRQAVGNPNLEARGKIQQAEGAVRKAFGKARDTLRTG